MGQQGDGRGGDEVREVRDLTVTQGVVVDPPDADTIEDIKEALATAGLL